MKPRAAQAASVQPEGTQRSRRSASPRLNWLTAVIAVIVTMARFSSPAWHWRLAAPFRQTKTNHRQANPVKDRLRPRWQAEMLPTPWLVPRHHARNRRPSGRRLRVWLIPDRKQQSPIRARTAWFAAAGFATGLAPYAQSPIWVRVTVHLADIAGGLHDDDRAPDDDVLLVGALQAIGRQSIDHAGRGRGRHKHNKQCKDQAGCGFDHYAFPQTAAEGHHLTKGGPHCCDPPLIPWLYVLRYRSLRRTG